MLCLFLLCVILIFKSEIYFHFTLRFIPWSQAIINLFLAVLKCTSKYLISSEYKEISVSWCTRHESMK